VFLRAQLSRAEWRICRKAGPCSVELRSSAAAADGLEHITGYGFSKRCAIGA
jgi:hypothetical protein